MKRDLEQEMAEALRGQFFWEKTSKYEDLTTGYAAEIRRAQRKFVEKVSKEGKPPPMTIDKNKKIQERIAATKLLPDEIKKIKAEILKYYGLSERDFEGEVGTKKLFPARSHYIWSVIRYNPNVSLAGFGKTIGKHHSTIIHHRDLFESNKHLFEENIKAIDAIFGYKETP